MMPEIRRRGDACMPIGAGAPTFANAVLRELTDPRPIQDTRAHRRWSSANESFRRRNVGVTRGLSELPGCQLLAGVASARTENPRVQAHWQKQKAMRLVFRSSSYEYPSIFERCFTVGVRQAGRICASVTLIGVDDMFSRPPIR